MRPNKASRFNRAMMMGTMFMGIIVLGCVFFFLYWAGNAQNDKQEQNERKMVGDSLVIEVEDSAYIFSEEGRTKN